MKSLARLPKDHNTIVSVRVYRPGRHVELVLDVAGRAKDPGASFEMTSNEDWSAGMLSIAQDHFPDQELVVRGVPYFSNNKWYRVSWFEEIPEGETIDASLQ